MVEIRKWNYGEYSSDNYGVHSLAFAMPQGDFYFSYNTLVAFKSNKSRKLYVRKNIWGNTTGKHLNWIDGGNKQDRLSQSEFEDALKKEGVM